MTKRIPVVGAAIIENGKLLAAKRTEGRSLGGYWEFQVERLIRVKRQKKL
ncbi:hypothetical protein [Weissella cibaria]|nr:hypothetical protein [Weissella cibaria]